MLRRSVPRFNSLEDGTNLAHLSKIMTVDDGEFLALATV